MNFQVSEIVIQLFTYVFTYVLEQTGCIAATKLVWSAVILAGPLTSGRALICIVGGV